MNRNIYSTQPPRPFNHPFINRQTLESQFVPPQPATRIRVKKEEPQKKQSQQGDQQKGKQSQQQQQQSQQMQTQQQQQQSQQQQQQSQQQQQQQKKQKKPKKSGALMSFDKLQVGTVASSSGIFNGKNIQFGWSSHSKRNTGFGTVGGHNNTVDKNTNVVFDNDQLDTPIDDRDTMWSPVPSLGRIN